MNRGKKQSPFIGRRVPLVDDGVPILYARYRDVSEVLLDGTGNSKKRPVPEQAEAAAPAANGHAELAAAAAALEQPSKKKSKKEKQQQQQQQQQEKKKADEPKPAAASEAVVTPAVVPADESEEQHALRLRREEKARKKREKQARRAAELAAEAAAAAAGGAEDNAEHAEQQQQQQQQQQQAQDEEDKGNAEEAARIRSVLGFTAGAAGSTAAPAAAAPAAAKVPPPSSGFTFNFSGLAGLPTEARVAAETEAKLAAIQAVTAADKDGFVPRRVFVGGMPYSYSREQVAEYWSWCGDIESLDCMTFPDTGRFRGIAFITFTSQEAADSALQYDGEQLEGQTLKVERCKAAAAAKHMKAAATVSGHRRQQQQQHNADGSTEQAEQPAAAAAAAGGVQSSSGPGKTAGYNVAYVGNIAFEAGPDDLKVLFADCGVTKVRLHTDKATGKSKGYAHVHFADEAGLDKAISLSGSQLHGRGIKVGYGQPKKN